MFAGPASQIAFNSLAPERFGCDFKNLIFNLILLIGILRSLYDDALRWMPRNITDDKSTLVQVMAWCRQATSHYLRQCGPRSMSPYGVIRPQWVKKYWLTRWISKLHTVRSNIQVFRWMRGLLLSCWFSYHQIWSRTLGSVLSSSPHDSPQDTLGWQIFTVFLGLADGTVYKTESIFRGLWHGKVA